MFSWITFCYVLLHIYTYSNKKHNMGRSPVPMFVFDNHWTILNQIWSGSSLWPWHPSSFSFTPKYSLRLVINTTVFAFQALSFDSCFVFLFFFFNSFFFAGSPAKQYLPRTPVIWGAPPVYLFMRFCFIAGFFAVQLNFASWTMYLRIELVNKFVCLTVPEVTLQSLLSHLCWTIDTHL